MSVHSSLREHSAGKQSNATRGQAKSAGRKRTCQKESAERTAAAAKSAGVSVATHIQRCVIAKKSGAARVFSSSSTPAANSGPTVTGRKK